MLSEVLALLGQSVSQTDLLFHSSAWVNLKFHRLDGTTETLVIFPRIFIVGVVFWVIDMFFRSVDAKSLFSHFKLFGGIAERQEA